MKNLPVGEQSGRQIPACRVEGIAFYLAILPVIILITPKFGWSAAILLQKGSVKITDIIKAT